jgi:hypothetical protein
MRQFIVYLQTPRKPMIQLGGRKILCMCNILIEYGIPMNLVKLIARRLNQTNRSVRVIKHLSDMFPIRNGLRQGEVLSALLYNFVLKYAIRMVQVNLGWLEIKWYRSAFGLC